MELIRELPAGNIRTAHSIPRHGMMRAQRQVVSAAQKVSIDSPRARPMVDMMQGQHLYNANAKVLKTMDQMAGTLLNTRA